MAAADGNAVSASDGDEFEVDLEAMITTVFEDILANIIHDVVRDVHRSEKMLRMASAATQISIIAQNNLQSPHPANDTPTKPAASFQASQMIRTGKVETSYAIYNDGVIYLKGNPLQTTTQIICPQCRLPRLLFPVVGAGSRLPDDLNVQYCTKHPYVSKAGHDMYGMAFPSDQAKSKKERELAKRQEKDSTPASQGSDLNGLSYEEQVARLLPQGKGANYIPWQTCPKCKRSLLITRFAQHLEKCLGISGRQSSRNAMAKLSGQNGSSAGTPMGSRPGTPAPAASVAGSENKSQKRDRDDDDADELDDVPLKKMKKRPYLKKGDRTGTQTSMDASSQGDEQEAKRDKLARKDSDAPKIVLKMKASTSGSPSKPEANLKRPPNAGSAGEGKLSAVKKDRDKEKEEDDVSPKKKSKLGTVKRDV